MRFYTTPAFSDDTVPAERRPGQPDRSVSARASMRWRTSVTHGLAEERAARAGGAGREDDRSDRRHRGRDRGPDPRAARSIRMRFSRSNDALKLELDAREPTRARATLMLRQAQVLTGRRPPIMLDGAESGAVGCRRASGRPCSTWPGERGWNSAAAWHAALDARDTADRDARGHGSPKAADARARVRGRQRRRRRDRAWRNGRRVESDAARTI